MLGYCRDKDCEKLVPIIQGSQKWGTRERTYYPVPHERPDGTQCPGDKKGL